ncbi:MAG TPA: efflux transporter outer membrane subunit [Caulobacteraceae bacterium]|jgi:NodT family efflux transporter outer membrane factor (OMF) lipoprotein|nr:efflux transporter outer membrane subunit [Caulobacteraceae bacterium]
MSRKSILFVIVGVASLSACAAVGPNYHEPRTATPGAYLESGSGSLSATAGGGADVAQWWTQFRDPELERLALMALRENPDIESGVSRIREARQQEIIAGAQGKPQVNLDGSVNNTMLSKNAGFSQLAKAFGGGGSSGGGSGGGSGGSGSGGSGSGGSGTGGGGPTTGIGLPGTDFTTYTLGFDASWEIDVFGGVRRSVESARDQTGVQLWSLRDTEVSLSAEVATDYLSLRSLQQQILVANRETARQQDLLKLVKARRTAGLAADLDVEQQQTQVANSLSQTPTLEANARAEIHALGVLTGQSPEALADELTPTRATPTVPPQVPVGLPSDLLRRRPDVRQAERQLASATANIGVATAALYPRFSLTGSADLISESLKNLISPNSLQTSITGAVTWPIFDAGKGRANVRTAREKEVQAYAAYRKSVLGALKDVEDALSRYGAEQRRNAALGLAALSADRAYREAEGRYRSGLADFTTVLNSEGALFSAESQKAQSDGALATDLVSLYKALGGGWESQAS